MSTLAPYSPYFPASLLPPSSLAPGPYSMLPGATGLGGLPGSATGILQRGVTPAASRLGSLFTGPAGPSGLPRIAGSLAEDAAGIGGRAASSSLLSRLPSLSGLISGGSVAKYPTLGGLGYGIAGQVGSNVIDKLNPGGQNSNIEQGLQGAATGAGIGAGLGLAGGPFAPLTSGAGALIGGALGGAVGVLGNVFGWGGGGDKEEAPNPVTILGNAIHQAGLTPDQTESVLDVYETQMALAEIEEDDDLKKQKQDAAYEQAGQMILSLMGQQQAAQSTASNSLALQAQSRDIFEPLAQDLQSSGAAYASAMQGINKYLPPQFKAINDANVARELTASDRLANAYRAQAAVIPTVNALTQYQQDYQSMANQLMQQSFAQGQAGSGGGASGQPTMDQLIAASGG